MSALQPATEKHDVERSAEDFESDSPEPQDYATAKCPPHTTEKRLMAKIDFRVVPWLCIMYLLAFLDRVNIGNAKIFYMLNPKSQGGLALKGTEYNTALVIFFVPYILCEVPSNIILKRTSPHAWLSICMFFFGLITICQGLVSSYGGLLAARFFLGLAETGMFPGCFYLLSMWYKRTEAQRRYSFFFNSTTLAGAFGGLLAAAIGKMDGLQGYRGWRWIFILEGTATCVISFGLYFLLPDFPENARFLKPEEKAYVKARLEEDQGRSAVDRPIQIRDVLNFFFFSKDWKVYFGALNYFGLIVPAYGYAYFSPTIIQTYHYSPIQTQLHSVPPWAAAFGFAMILAYLSDKTKHRFGWIVFAICISITGFAMLISIHDNLHAQYAALFLVAAGTYSAMPIIVCWFCMNLGGHHRRSIGSAWQVAFGNIGGIIAVFVFLQKDSPRFVPGYSTCLAFTCLSLLSCTVYFLLCWLDNRKRDRMPKPVGQSTQEMDDMGDLRPSYRYLY